MIVDNEAYILLCFPPSFLTGATHGIRCCFDACPRAPAEFTNVNVVLCTARFLSKAPWMALLTLSVLPQGLSLVRHRTPTLGCS